MSLKQLTTILLLACLPTACTLEPRRTEPPPDPRNVVQPAPPSEAEQLLAYAAKLRRMDRREFTVERDQLRANVLKDHSDLAQVQFNRIKYALLLTLAVSVGTGTSDDAELIGTLEPIVGAVGFSADNELRVIANLIYVAAQERRKLREQLRESHARIALVRREDNRDAEIRALRAKVEELEKNLNALKSIDRSVNRRAEPIAK